VIKASALLAAVAIGLLVAGVAASSLLMVYVSIGVCAVAALILAVGILAHWSEIFGRGEARPASVPGAWSAPQVGVSSRPELASALPTAGAGRQERHEDAGGPPAGEQAAAVRPEEEFPVAGRSDDLWERVEEELGSAGKRDTGALSWPATEVPVFREDPGSPEQATPPGKPGPQDASPAGTSAWIWGRGAGWQPPETSGPAWPPPAAAFAGSSARPEPAQDADDSAPDDTGPDGTGPDDGSAAGGAAASEPGEPAAAEPAAGPGRVEVTVVPGVARYHRSGCILIRFLGADDLEIMTRQEAEEASFVPCRACQPDQLEA